VKSHCHFDKNPLSFDIEDLSLLWAILAVFPSSRLRFAPRAFSSQEIRAKGAFSKTRFMAAVLEKARSSTQFARNAVYLHARSIRIRGFRVKG
jgi:hypothetical protein